MIPVGAVILWSTPTADTPKIRDYCWGIRGAATFQDINKSIPTISAREAPTAAAAALERSRRSAACWLETGHCAPTAVASIRWGSASSCCHSVEQTDRRHGNSCVLLDCITCLPARVQLHRCTRIQTHMQATAVWFKMMFAYSWL